MGKSSALCNKEGAFWDASPGNDVKGTQNKCGLQCDETNGHKYLKCHDRSIGENSLKVVLHQKTQSVEGVCVADVRRE